MLYFLRDQEERGNEEASKLLELWWHANKVGPESWGQVFEQASPEMLKQLRAIQVAAVLTGT